MYNSSSEVQNSIMERVPVPISSVKRELTSVSDSNCPKTFCRFFVNCFVEMEATKYCSVNSTRLELEKTLT